MDAEVGAEGLVPWLFYRVCDSVFTSDAGRTLGRWDAAL